MSNVLAVKEWKKEGRDPVWYVTVDDRTDNVPCYDPSAANLKLREPLPEGWSVERSKKGTDYLKTPNTSSGRPSAQSSWYNSEAGVRFTQERMDRRTALMQAVATKTLYWETWVNSDNPTPQTMPPFSDWKNIAEDMYEWLRGEGQTDAEVPITERTTDPIPEPTSVAATGKGSADDSKGEVASSGGPKRATSPEESPWAGMGVE